jgi:hypothetical protein
VAHALQQCNYTVTPRTFCGLLACRQHSSSAQNLLKTIAAILLSNPDSSSSSLLQQCGIKIAGELEGRKLCGLERGQLQSSVWVLYMPEAGARKRGPNYSQLWPLALGAPQLH